MRTAVLLAAFFAAAAVVCAVVTKVPGETVLHLAFGWAAFLTRSIARLTVNWNGVATAIVCIVLLLLGGHPFLKWLVTAARSPHAGSPSNDSGPQTSAPATRPWPLRRTAQLLAVFMLLFIAGTAFIGLVHQAAWLATAPEPLSGYRLKLYVTDPSSNPKFVGLGFNTFQDIYRQCPPNGAATDLKQGSHSWQTRILPFMSVSTANIDMARDWNDPKNAPAFRRFVDFYLNPDIGDLREGRGYAVSHYAGNSHWFAHRHATTSKMDSRGASNTIFCGEVANQFMAWGDPGNLRDPAAGVNRSAAGFGSTDERGAYFTMVDGSVRFLATDTDPHVLAALAGISRDAAEAPFEPVMRNDGVADR